MNIGVILVGLMLAAGSVLGIFMLAGSHQTAYVDSFGDTQSNATNLSQSTITNVTAPIAGAGAGAVLLIAALLLLAVATILIKTAFGSHGGRR